MSYSYFDQINNTSDSDSDVVYTSEVSGEVGLICIYMNITDIDLFD